MIEFTADHFSAMSNDERLLADADLYILGESDWRYDHYVCQVRREYSHIPKVVFNYGRRKFLRKLINRIFTVGRLSYSLSQEWERQAKKNINRELGTPDQLV